VGYIGPNRDVPFAATIYQAFLDELQFNGFRNGENLVVDYRPLEQDLPALSAAAADLVRLNANVLLADGTETALQAAISSSQTLPIVMIATNFDPFAGGYVKVWRDRVATSRGSSCARLNWLKSKQSFYWKQSLVRSALAFCGIPSQPPSSRQRSGEQKHLDYKLTR
jgi:hypothetical protein